jgi:glycosyltransferase involved in cell wall biosynthesis
MYIRHCKNRGKGASLATGIKESSGEIIVIQDADLEYFPENIPALVEPILARKADLIYGTRFSKGLPEGMSFSHYVCNRLLSLAATIMYGVKITDVMTGYKAFRRKVVNHSGLKSKGFGVEIELTALALCNNWRLKEIPLEYRYRKKGASKIRYKDGFTCLWQLIIGRFEARYH